VSLNWIVTKLLAESVDDLIPASENSFTRYPTSPVEDVPGLAGTDAEDAHTVEAAYPDGQVRFEASHSCGETHQMTGWRTVTPGLVVFLDGPPNTPRVPHKPNEQWSIWQLGGFETIPERVSDPGVVVTGYEDPESAIRAAERIGQFRAGQMSSHELLTEIIGRDYVLEPIVEPDDLPTPPPPPPSLDLDDGGW
jgi:hypothetical protein